MEDHPERKGNLLKTSTQLLIVAFLVLILFATGKIKIKMVPINGPASQPINFLPGMVIGGIICVCALVVFWLAMPDLAGVEREYEETLEGDKRFQERRNVILATPIEPSEKDHCQYCLSKLAPEDKFCHYCGAPIKKKGVIV